NDDEPSNTKQRRVLSEIIVFVMFMFICFVPITYGRENGILMGLPQSDCCCSQVEGLQSASIACLSNLYERKHINYSEPNLLYAIAGGRMTVFWRALDTNTATVVLHSGFSLNFDLIRESKSILIFTGDDDNYLFTMLGSPSPSPWQGSHTQIVVATVMGIWYRFGIRIPEPYLSYSLGSRNSQSYGADIRGNGSRATTSTDEPTDDIASSSAHIWIGLLQMQARAWTLNKYNICTGIPELATWIKELNNIDAYVEMFSFKRWLATAAAGTFF
ncbi:hypothetical protein Tco_0911690, partial [Tanacetum coccineum]